MENLKRLLPFLLTIPTTLTLILFYIGADKRLIFFIMTILLIIMLVPALAGMI